MVVTSSYETGISCTAKQTFRPEGVVRSESCRYSTAANEGFLTISDPSERENGCRKIIQSCLSGGAALRIQSAKLVFLAPALHDLYKFRQRSLLGIYHPWASYIAL